MDEKVDEEVTDHGKSSNQEHLEKTTDILAEKIAVIQPSTSDVQNIQGLYVIPEGEDPKSGVKVEYINAPSLKKLKLDSEDSNEEVTYILAVEPQIELTESLVSKSGQNEEETMKIISPAEMTPAQQNAMAAFNDPNTPNSINQQWFTSKVGKSYLKVNKAQAWRTGMWSKDEIALLQSNIDAYCKEHAISDPAVIIFEMNKSKRKDFYRVIAKGLNRPLFNVYRRVIRMYDKKNHVGKYSAEELETLKMLRAKHGKNWLVIGQEMGRSAASIKDKCRLLKDNCNQGPWLPEEEHRLAQAVYDLAQAVPGEIVYSGLSWSAISKRVITRSEKQCRTKWLNYLNWKEFGGTEWTRDDDIILVSEVCNLNVPDENAIDWAVLSEGWPSVRSPQWLRSKWVTLKSQVKDDCKKTFQELCKHLYKHHVQNVNKKESSSKAGKPAKKSSSNRKQTLLSSNIPFCAEVSICGDESVPDSSSTIEITEANSMLTTYTVVPSRLEICVPGTIGSGSSQTILLAPSDGQVTEAAVIAQGSSDSPHIIMQPISSDLLENVDKFELDISANEQVVISSPHQELQVLQATNEAADSMSESNIKNDLVVTSNNEVIPAVVIKSSDLLATDRPSFPSPPHNEISDGQVDQSDTSKLISADPMLGASQHSPETISEHLTQEIEPGNRSSTS